jgi:hypothetical protein
MLLQHALPVACLIGLLAADSRVGPAQPGPLPSYGSPGVGAEGTQIPPAILEYYHALGWIRSYAAKLESIHGRKRPEIIAPLQQIQNDARFLQQKWIEWPRRHPRQRPYAGNVNLDRYFRTLQQTHKLLKALQKSNDGALLETIQAVAEDMRAKAENCRHSADGLGKEIKVTVRTVLGTQEVGGYEVWCAPAALVRFVEEHIRFPRVSSPTVMKNLAPGRYAIWLVKGEEKLRTISQIIGGHGERECDIDLPVHSASEPPP